MGIWWVLRLVGILDERNVVEWSVLRCSGCRVSYLRAVVWRFFFERIIVAEILTFRHRASSI